MRSLRRTPWSVPPRLAGLLVMAACARAVTPPRAEQAAADLRAIPKVDVHSHYRTDAPGLVPALEAWNARAVLVDVTGGDRDIDAKWRDFLALRAAHPGRFSLVATFDPFRIAEPDFATTTIERLRAEIAQGAKAVKVWKDIGMEVKNADGSYVQIDDPRFQPIWDFLAEQHVPVMAHIAEPLAAWRPLTPESPHYWYYSHNPQYHAFAHPEIPQHETIIAARDRWLARNPRLVVVGMHLASLEYDVDEVAKRLDAYPNLSVETAARINDLAMQPSEKVRAFFVRYADRIMWGTDFGEGSASGAALESGFVQLWRYFASAVTVTLGSANGWHRTVRGLGLPRDVLERFAHGNAERILGLPKD
jgi:predicted TIM-barrel fold metal-dependent hydrolase